MDYTLATMIEQLGFESAEQVQSLNAKTGKLTSGTLLADAEFWNQSQSAFLREAIESDGPWAPAAGQLDALLRT